MHKSYTAFSKNVNDRDQAFAEILEQLKQIEKSPQLILFSSCNPLFTFVSQKLHEHFPKSILIGSTSCYQFNSAGDNEFGISVMAIEGGIDVSAGIFADVGKYPMKHIGQLEKALSHFDTYENMCCIEFTTAQSNAEELVLDTLSKYLKDREITIFGGTSGACSLDNSSDSMVCLNGTVYTNSCVFVLIKNLDGKIFVHKENIFKPTKNVFTVTDVDCDNRIVYEYNHEPAALAIAKTLETDVSHLSAMLEGKPMGRCVNDDVYITEAKKVNDDYSISYYSQIYNYTKIALMRTENIPEVFANTKRTVKNNIDSSFMIVVNCASRKNLLEKEGLTGIFMSSLKSMAPSYIGISGYGEQINSVHLNQTMVLIAFE